MEDVAERLQDIGVAALTIHGRTRVQLYKGDADWTLIGRIKNNPRITIPIFGNGDIDSPEKALEYRNRYGVDGIMIGRASIGNPWVFNHIKHFFATGQYLPESTLAERIAVCRQHLDFSLRWKGPVLGVVEMRRHYSNYFRALPDFKPFRTRLVQENDPATLFALLEEITHTYRSTRLVESPLVIDKEEKAEACAAG